jgi:predicted DNA-binding WGR domain protein
MGHGTVSTLGLHRVDAARNMARFYADEAAAETAMARLARIKSGRGYLRLPDPVWPKNRNDGKIGELSRRAPQAQRVALWVVFRYP